MPTFPPPNPNLCKSSFGHSPCDLRVFVYTSLLPNLTATIRYGRWYGNASAACPEGFALDAGDHASLFPPSFKVENLRQYSSEIPVAKRLMEACTLVDEPKDADLFLVPFPFSTVGTAGWAPGTQPERHVERNRLRNEVKRVALSLSQLNEETATRHLYLWSTDSDWTPSSMAVRPLEHLNPLMARGIFLHLGDDHYRGRCVPPPWNRSCAYDEVRLPRNRIERSITVPYRTSAWLPLGFPPPPLRKTSLLWVNVDQRRSGVRVRLAKAIQRSAAKMNLTRLLYVSVSANMGTPLGAAKGALASTFCLTPTGDSKGFTARFYFSLVHLCIPVRVDGWERNLTFDETAYPYPSRIDWRRVVVDVPAWEESSLLAKLAAMPAAEVAERLRYIRSIGHWLTFDRRLDGVEDAADGAVAEIGRLLRGHDPHAVRRGFERSEGGRAERARAENASALAGEEYRAHLEEAAEAEAARVARAEDARARFATPPKRRPRPHETPFTVNM